MELMCSSQTAGGGGADVPPVVRQSSRCAAKGEKGYIGVCFGGDPRRRVE